MTQSAGALGGPASFSSDYAGDSKRGSADRPLCVFVLSADVAVVEYWSLVLVGDF